MDGEIGMRDAGDFEGRGFWQDCFISAEVSKLKRFWIASVKRL